jgi:hypothetical protein
VEDNSALFGRRAFVDKPVAVAENCLTQMLGEPISQVSAGFVRRAGDERRLHLSILLNLSRTIYEAYRADRL